MASLNVVFRPSTKKGRHPGSLFLRLIHLRKPLTRTLTGCRIYPDEWDKRSQVIVFPADDPRRITYLKEVENQVAEESNRLTGLIQTLEKEGRYSLEDLCRLYKRKKDDGKLLSYAEYLAIDQESKGKNRTARAYRTVSSALVKFNKGIDIPLQQINACLIQAFETHLKDRGCLPNTISFYMRNLRAIYNKAVNGGLIVKRQQENPFEGAFTGVTKTMKRALTLEEIQKYNSLDFESMLEEKKDDTRQYAYTQRLSAGYRYFNFCLYARGMCFIDLAYLKKSNLRSGIIRYVRKKTGQQIEVRVTPEMEHIIDSFVADTAGSPFLFPIIRDTDKPYSLQYENALRSQNQRLKKLASLAGINRPVSTHWARHSWATVGKIINVPTSVISECLGHTSEKTTRIYLAQLNNSVLDEANERIAFAINNYPNRIQP